jgi:hypothetical protein
MRHMGHLFNSDVLVASNDHVGPRCLEVNWDLHSNLSANQSLCLVGPTAILGEQPAVAKVHERAQQYPGKTWSVSAHGTQPTILTEGAAGVVIHVHLRTVEQENITISLQSTQQGNTVKLDWNEQHYEK